MCGLGESDFDVCGVITARGEAFLCQLMKNAAYLGGAGYFFLLRQWQCFCIIVN